MRHGALQALIFDVDGTLADTGELHRAAYNDAFARAGLDWHWSAPVYEGLLALPGGRRRLAAYRASRRRGRDPHAIDREIDHLYRLKTDAYARRIRDDGAPLRPGARALIESAGAAGLRLAIAATTSAELLDGLLGRALGPDWRARFDTVEDTGTAPRRKPDPQAYLQALARLALPADRCLAFEDTHGGLRAARGAGLRAIVVPNAYSCGQDFGGALRVLGSLEDVTPLRLHGWHAAATAPRPLHLLALH